MFDGLAKSLERHCYFRTGVARTGVHASCESTRFFLSITRDTKEQPATVTAGKLKPCVHASYTANRRRSHASSSLLCNCYSFVCPSLHPRIPIIIASPTQGPSVAHLAGHRIHPSVFPASAPINLPHARPPGYPPHVSPPVFPSGPLLHLSLPSHSFHPHIPSPSTANRPSRVHPPFSLDLLRQINHRVSRATPLTVRRSTRLPERPLSPSAPPPQRSTLHSLACGFLYA